MDLWMPLAFSDNSLSMEMKHHIIDVMRATVAVYVEICLSLYIWIGVHPSSLI
jgi:hypothetical protein